MGRRLRAVHSTLAFLADRRRHGLSGEQQRVGIWLRCGHYTIGDEHDERGRQRGRVAVPLAEQIRDGRVERFEETHDEGDTEGRFVGEDDWAVSCLPRRQVRLVCNPRQELMMGGGLQGRMDGGLGCVLTFGLPRPTETEH